MQQRRRDLVILAVVVLAILIGAELLTRLSSWNSVQTCFSLDRDNCLPRIYLREVGRALEE